MYTTIETEWDGETMLHILGPEKSHVLSLNTKGCEAVVHCLLQIEEFLERRNPTFIREEKRLRYPSPPAKRKPVIIREGSEEELTKLWPKIQ